MKVCSDLQGVALQLAHAVPCMHPACGEAWAVLQGVDQGACSLLVMSRQVATSIR